MVGSALIMHECVEFARGYAGFTKSNPLVGAAVVKDGKVLNYGCHKKFGSKHAEIDALDIAGDTAFGAELFVTLEPCSTYGKTPPCVERIIQSKIKKVHIGVIDPNPIHSGAGVKILQDAGIEVSVGVNALECAMLIEDFVKSKLTGMPYTTIKIAMSADGRIATSTGDSKWITCPDSLEKVHLMRGSAGAVLVGVGTVVADDPILNNRLAGAERQPARVVLDTSCRIGLGSKLVRSAKDFPLIIYTSDKAPKEKIERLRELGADICIVGWDNGLDLAEVLRSLYSKEIMTVFIEGGSSVFGSFNDTGLADKLELFIAPKIIGGVSAKPAVGGKGALMMSDIKEFVSMDSEMSGKDVLIHARLKDYTKETIEMTNKFVKES